MSLMAESLSATSSWTSLVSWEFLVCACSKFCLSWRQVLLIVTGCISNLKINRYINTLGTKVKKIEDEEAGTKK